MHNRQRNGRMSSLSHFVMWIVATISSKFLALSYFFDMAPKLFQKVESLTFQKMYGGICHLKWYRWPNFMDLAHGLVSVVIQVVVTCNITMMSQWASWRPKSPATQRLFNYLLWPKKHQSSASLALCEGNSPVTGEFPTQWASNAAKSFHLMTSSWMNKSKLICLLVVIHKLAHGNCINI